MNKEIISTPAAPAAIGPYSQAVKAGNLLFCSGQIPLDPASGTLVEDTVRAQTVRALENLKAVLAQAGASMDSVVKTTVFLRDMDDFAGMNQVYQEFFQRDCPARSAVQAAKLPRNARVEIEAIAVL